MRTLNILYGNVFFCDARICREYNLFDVVDGVERKYYCGEAQVV